MSDLIETYKMFYYAQSGNYFYFYNCIRDDTNVNIINETNGNTLLHYAVKGRYIKIVELLLKYNADPNIKNLFGKTPLMFCFSGRQINFKIAEILISAGADPNIKINGVPLLHLIIRDETLLDLCLEHGADPNIRDKHGKTFFEYLSDEKKEKYIQIPTKPAL
jgi:uncharacterized protein